MRHRKSISERPGQGLQHPDAARLPGRKQFQFTKAGEPGGDHVGGRHHSRQQRQAAFPSGFDQRRTQAGADAEAGAGIPRFGEVFGSGEGAGPDDGLRHLAGDGPDRRQRHRGAQGHLQHPHPTGNQGFG